MSLFDTRYDVALSYSREDREIALALAGKCREQGIRVFFDQWAVSQPWDNELLAHLHDLHRSSARYCLPLMSCNYVERVWTTRGLAGEEDCLLPVRLDDSYVPALRLAGPYFDIRNTGPAEIARLLRKKLDLAPAGPAMAAGDAPSDASANGEGEEQASRLVPGFDRVPVAHGPIVTAPEILEMLDRIGPTSPPRGRLRFGTDLRRLVSWHYLSRSGPVCTAWRAGNRVFLSMLPEIGDDLPGEPRQRTLEFEVNGASAAGLTLVAEWAATERIWQAIHYREFSKVFGDVVADRSGCNMFREVAVQALLLKGAHFAFPVAPTPGRPEQFCRWVSRDQGSPLEPPDWDRDPRIIDSPRANAYLAEPWIGINGSALLHRPTGVAVMITTLLGGWSANAVYALLEALNLLLPTRHDLRPLDAGCMRLSVFLARPAPPTTGGSYDREGYESQHPQDAIRLARAAIARAMAAQREIPAAPPSVCSALPRLHPKLGKAFRTCIEALGSHEHPDVTGKGAKAGDAAWEELADSGYGRRINVRQWWIPFDHARVVTRSDLAAFIEGCENQTLAL